MTDFQSPLTVGGLTLPNRVLLAPLAGVSDIPFRRICQELGAGLTYVEMLSAVAIDYRNKRTMEMCRRHPSEQVLGVQVTGPTAESVERAVLFLEELPFDTVDINMGCSVRKVVAAGSGSGMLSDPERISATVRGARSATGRPLTVKTRLGCTRRSISIEDTARRVAVEGADLFTVHGRTRNERYGTPVDLEGIRRGVVAARNAVARPVVVVGNGDLFDGVAARRMRETTGCDAVMISRGALGNPWIFREVLTGTSANPTLEEWGDVVMRHLDYQQEAYGDNELAAIRCRKHLLWYIKGYPCHKPLGEKLGLIKRIAEGRRYIREYLAEWPKDLVRFEGAHRTDSRLGPNSKYDPKYDPKHEMDRTHDRPVADGT